MHSIFAISTNSTDMAAFAIGVVLIIGLLLLARYLPEYIIGEPKD
jgi:hypothetical protein